MSASKVNPNMYNGEERSSGYVARNEKPTSANSPHWRGKLYLAGVGWYWVSVWEKGSESNPILSLRAQEMTDEQAAKFCAPKAARGPKAASNRQPKTPNDQRRNGSGSRDGEIPF